MPLEKPTQTIPTAGKMKHVTYEKAYQVVKSYEQQLAAQNFDLILAIARSGIVPATMISQAIGVPLEFVQCGRTDPEPRFLMPVDIKGKKILVVDDIIGLGLTIQKVIDFTRNLGASPTSFCLYFDEKTSQLRPEYGYSTAHFMHAQWDRKDVTPRSRQSLQDKNGRCDIRDTSECFGTDLDGIFLEDINRKSYRLEERIESVLAYRHSLPPMTDLPVINHEDIFVITARPEIDFSATREWLDKHGFSKVQLICRDQNIYGGSINESARFKAEQIINIGISKYFESDLMQAVLISKMTPCTDIYWWGKTEKLRIYTNPVTNNFTI